jgi:hypothetical protein
MNNFHQYAWSLAETDIAIREVLISIPLANDHIKLRSSPFLAVRDINACKSHETHQEWKSAVGGATYLAKVT